MKETAAEIEADAKEWAALNDDFLGQVEPLRANENGLFNFFIEAVKRNEYLKVSYILNCCFDSAQARANFGNKKNSLGNTAYHHAAQLGHDEIIIILNDKRKYKDKQVFFSFVEINDAGQTPLQLVCENPKLSTFKLIWQRAGKSSHNPCYAVESAIKGGNQEIIKTIQSHPKFPKEAKTRKTESTEGLKRFALHPVEKMGEVQDTKKSRVDDKEENHVERNIQANPL